MQPLYETGRDLRGETNATRLCGCCLGVGDACRSLLLRITAIQKIETRVHRNRDGSIGCPIGRRSAPVVDGLSQDRLWRLLVTPRRRWNGWDRRTRQRIKVRSWLKAA